MICRILHTTLVASMLLITGTAAAHVRLIAPNGGEQLEVGSTFTVEWTVVIKHSQLNWDLWYSTTGPDGPWIEAAMDLPAGNFEVGSIHTFEWTIPDAVSDEVRVRVRMDNSGTDYFDVSDDDFSIISGCHADVNGDGLVNTQDFIAFLNLWVAGDSLADWNGDGMVNTQDFIAFLNDWVAGC